MKIVKFNASLAAATSQAKTLAAPVVSDTKPAKPAKAVKDEPTLVQFNVRLEPALRERIRHAALLWRVSERELIERWAADLPEVTPPPKGKPWK